EQRSAEFAARALTELGLEAPTIQRVCDLIMLTRTHVRPESDAEADLFLTLDLSILGAEPAAYAHYVASIRKEYAWVSDFDFCTGRRKVLEAFKARPVILSEDWHDRFSEKQARANIAAEIAQIDEQLGAMS